jgi:phage terminase large subunit GpA-like protein
VTVAIAAMKLAEVLAVLEPPPALTVSEWADAERRLPIGASAEPGPWRTDREPYQRGLMDAVHEGAETIVIQKSAQVGATEVLLNAIGYHIAHDPSPILLVEPTESLAKRLSKHRLGPMLRDTPALRARVADPRGRRSTSTLLLKAFPGGFLALVGANSPTPLASDPIRLLLADEIDKYPPYVGDEGDPLALAMKRTTTFWNRLHVLTSTPTVKGLSRIESWFSLSDQRRYFVPCPRCGEAFVLEWRHVRWEGGAGGDPETAHFVCPACGGRILDHERPGMIARGAWRATAPFRGVIGFHLWEAYSSRARLARIVRNFLVAKSRGVEALREWVNQTLGETWEEAGEQARPEVLVLRREAYSRDRLPAGVVCLTAGVDVQDDRLEVSVWGWGLGEESWVIEHRVLPGDPARPEPWQLLDEVLQAPYPHAGGARLPIHATCVDTAGHRSSYAYDYVLKRQHLRVFATIGRDGDRPIVSAPSEKRFGRDPRPVRLYTIGVDMAKALLASRLQLTAIGPGFVHLPKTVDEEFIAQLTAEKLVTRYAHGVPVRQWIQTRPRNEALDCANLALAALRLLNPRLAAMAEILAATPPAPPAARPDAPGPAATPAAPPQRRMVPSPYLMR